MSEIERLSEADLVSAFRAGDPDAFAEIYDRYSAEIFSHFLGLGMDRESAADATHDTFIEAAAQLELRDHPEDLRSWLVGIGNDVSGAPEDSDGAPELVAAPPALRPRVLSKVDRGVTTPPPKTNTKEWARLATFAAVTLVLGLIGLGVSAQFDRLAPRTSTPIVTTPPQAAAPSTTAAPARGPTSTTGGPPSTSSTVAQGAPAAIEVSTDTVNFGGDGTVGEFDVVNSGEQGADFSVTASTGSITLSQEEGRVGGGESVTIEMTLDRETLEEGDLDQTITVAWSAGEIAIAVVGSNEANPIIHNPLASPSSVEVSGDEKCTNTQTTVSARVRDASPLESVVARWSPDGGGTLRETEMIPVGDDMFEAVVGPFTLVGSSEVRVVAFDDRGNAGGASALLSVADCP